LHWRSWLILALFVVAFLSSNVFVMTYTTGTVFHDGYYYNGRGFALGSPATYWVSLRFWCRGRERERLTEQVSLPGTVEFSLSALAVNFFSHVAMAGIVVGISEAIHRRRFSLLALLIWVSLWAVVLGMELYARQISVKATDLTPPTSATVKIVACSTRAECPVFLNELIFFANFARMRWGGFPALFSVVVD